MQRNSLKYILVVCAAALVLGLTLFFTLPGSPLRKGREESTEDRSVSETERTEEEKPSETVSAEETGDVPSDEKPSDKSAEEASEEASSESTDNTSEEPSEEDTAETTVEDAAETSEPLPLRDPEAIIDVSDPLYTYEKMTGDLQYLASAYPQYVRLQSAGTTEDGRDLVYAVFGNPDAPRQIYICAATHAREYMTAQLVMRQLAYYCAEYETGSYNGVPFREIFDSTCFYVEPMVNPDGVTISQLGEAGLQREDLRENLRRIFESDLAGGTAETDDYAAYLTRWKANALGVDINRNYSPGWESVTDRAAPSSTFYKGSAPGSERETQAQMAIVNSMSNPLLAVSYHSYGDLVYWQYGQPEPLWSENQALAQHISDMTGQYLAGYSNEAGFSNWCITEKQLKSVTVETGTVPAPLPIEQFPELWGEHRMIWAMLAVNY